MKIRFIPKIFIVLKEGYNLKKFLQDFNAGIIVGIVALPLSIALAIASGVKPEQGLYTAIIGGFCISFFGGSRVQIGGPTGAFVVIIYSIIQKHGYEGLVAASIMAGILLIIFGILKLGTIIKYIPYPVTIGFTSGIAVLIFTSQVKDFLGLKINSLPSEFIDKIILYFKSINTINIPALIVGLSTIIISILWSRKIKKIPGSIIAIIITTAVCYIFNLPIETIGSRFGEVPNSLPFPALPVFNFLTIKTLFLPALTIALLAGIESLLSAVVADGMIGSKHNSNVELIAQGIANIISPIFGGIPATGAIARTATNIKNGGRTPFAGIIHATTLLVIMLFLGKYAKLIPMATLAGILIIISYNMSEIRHFVKLLRSPKSDITVLLVTFLLTIFFDLTIAIQFGVVMASLLFIKRMSEVSEAKIIKREDYSQDEEFIISGITEKNIPKKIEIFEINGPFFFGATSVFKDTLARIDKRPDVLILRMRNVPAIDATGLSALEWIIEKSKDEGTEIIISGIKEQPYKALKRTNLIKKLTEKNIFEDVNMAIKRAKEILKNKNL